MKNYQLTYLISPELKEEEVQTLFSAIESLVQEQEGILISNQKEKTVTLGYEIKKYKKALLSVLKFQMDPAKQKSFLAKIREKPEILRFLIETAKPISAEKKVAKRVKKITKKAKVELKGIEEKLEEILGE